MPVAMQIRYERLGRCLWHLHCPENHFGGIMHVVRHEEARSLLKCGHCGQQGYYPKGGVGTIHCEVAPPNA